MRGWFKDYDTNFDILIGRQELQEVIAHKREKAQKCPALVEEERYKFNDYYDEFYLKKFDADLDRNNNLELQEFIAFFDYLAPNRNKENDERRYNEAKPWSGEFTVYRLEDLF